MNYLAHYNTLIRPARRTAALLCAAALGLGLAATRTSAQVTGPLTTSPGTPTPFQAPVFHSGGGPGATFPIDTASAPYLDPLIDPLQGQLQGTPTEIYNGNLTQIPSYLLGNYDPTRPPTGLISDGAGGLINVYYPNHFADGSDYSWAAPFAYTLATNSIVTVDDTQAVAPNAFTSTGFAAVTDPVAFPAAGTATNGEYLRLASGVPGSAIWTLYQATAGNYSLYFHVPSDLPDANGNPELRDTQVVYSIAVRDANGNVTLTTNATANQVEANDSQFLAGPFQIASGGTVTVTLLRSNTLNNNADFLVADSMTLQPTVGDVQSAPTAITRDRFLNEFLSTTHPLQYWGIFVPPGSAVVTNTTAPTGTTTTAQLNAVADPDTDAAVVDPTGATAINQGNLLLHTGNPATAVNPANATNPTDPVRLIRQLVYFGRSDPSASVSSSVDDSAGAPGFTGNGLPVTNTTASGGKYKESGASVGVVAFGVTNATATWTVPVPSAGAGTGFFVYAHIPANLNGELRTTRAYYTVSLNGTQLTNGPVAISQVTQGTDALVALPTGALQAPAGSSLTVSLYAQNNSATTAPATGTVVVADSVTVSTGTGQGAIYCVDGFNGSVVWRFETPGSANGSSAPVFASPAVARINVMVTPPVLTGNVVTTPAVYANRLVVIVGDNNGLVYCLDAIGNGDGTSNVNSLAKDANGNPIPGQPVTIPQPPYAPGGYGAVATPLAPGPAATAAATAHVGTTGVYWIYRPDATQPKYVTGANTGQVKAIDPTTDLPVPAAFDTASPNIFVDPTINTGFTGSPPVATATPPTKSNSIVYIGNTNGVLYALDGGGAPIDGTSQATFNASGETLNVSQNLQGAFPQVSIPTAQPRWWFSLRGVDPNGAENTSAADIESAPAIHVTATGTGAATTYVPTVYIGSAHEQGVTSNVGRVYALNGLYGPSGNGGRLNPVNNVPTAGNYGGPGAFNYNVGQVPQISKTDAADWSFPDGNLTTSGPLAGYVHQSSNGSARPALGNITGSPVVFTNIYDTAAVQTRIYFAANSGKEYPAVDRPDDTQTGRIWAVNLDGSLGHTANGGNVWAYPLANDPNNAVLDATAEPVPPIGSFLRGTPAIGFVQFPNVTTNGDGSVYNPVDAVRTGGVNGTAVPMLYIGTRGVNDTALYAVNIDGNETATTDQRTIFRLVSPDGSVYQSSPALVTNATINNTGTGGTNNGNGGAVYAVAGNTMYDYSATPISNPFAGQAYPLIRLDREFVGIGPISSPTLAGANVSDLTSAAAFLGSGAATPGTTNTSGFSSLDTDWIYVGDSSSGFCRGITPYDLSYGGIPIELNQIVPYDPTPAQLAPLDTFIQTYLVDLQTSTSSADAKLVGLNAPLPVYEWGQNAYLRFTNAVPPNPNKDPKLFVYDTLQYTAAALSGASTSAPVPFYTANGTTAETITFNLSDTDATAGSVLQQTGSQQVEPRLITTPPDGFVLDAAATTAYPSFFTKNVTNLATTAGNHYLGTYTYAVGDSSPLGSTPGARRRVLNVQQTVDEYNYIGGDMTQLSSYQFVKQVISGTGGAVGENLITQIDPTTHLPTFNANSRVAAVDQPTFGVLNPLGVRGGGVNLLTPGTTAAVPIGDGTGAQGDALGPFRSVQSPPTLSTTGGTTTTIAGDNFALQALANGNNVPTVAPPSSSGVTGNPTVLANGANDPTGVSTPTTPAVVVTATGLIPDNSVNDNEEISALPTGQYSGTGTNGLQSTGFGGYSLNVFDRSDLFTLGQSLRLKMTIPSNVLFAPPSGRDGLYWNSNAPNTGYGSSGHDSVVNFLPWETPPTPYVVGSPNPSQDYPDISSGNIIQNAQSVRGSSGGDLSSNSVSLPQATGTASTPASRVMYADPVQIKITVPHYQPANQQLYQQPGSVKYTSLGEIQPVDTTTGNSQITAGDQAFPMGYVTTKRLYVPTATGNYSQQRPYRDVRIYTGVPVDMKTSIVNPTTDIGQVPAAFGVQTEQYTPLGFFTPYSQGTAAPNLNPFLNYFKPVEAHNDGNVNLLNVHFDQKYASFNNGSSQTLLLNSDAVDPLSALLGYDITPAGSANGVTGPRTAPEQPFLIRTPLDTDLVGGASGTLGRNPLIVNNFNTLYPGATFHKPLVGSDQPSTLTVPDAPEDYTANASLDSAPMPLVPSVVSPTNGLPYKSLPFVSLAIPFGTPVGTYSTPAQQSPLSLHLFEGLDPNTATAYNTKSATGFLYPPQYNGSIGGIKAPNTSTQGLTDIYTAGQPLSTTGTQLTATVIEQRLTDGSTYGAVPMIDAGPAGSTTPAGGGTAVPASTPDFAPAAFRDFFSGNLSVYWTSARGGGFSLYGANLPFVKDPATNDPKFGHFMPTTPSSQWWQPIPSLTSALAPGTNSGLSIAAAPFIAPAAFDVAVTNAPYSNTLYSYDVNPTTGTLSNREAVTPLSDAGQVKYGVTGLFGPGYNRSAFWTANTHGRTALYYNSRQPNGTWGTPALLPVPAGLTAVSDASPLVLTAPVTVTSGTTTSTNYTQTIEVTYSGTGPDGNADLYVSRFLPDAKTPTQLDLVPFPAVTEDLRLQGNTGWYQGRDTAWSRSGALNVTVPVTSSSGTVLKPLLYDSTGKPLFTRAIYDKASGFLVLTGVQVPYATAPANGTPTYTTNTIYVDAATGRIRFSPDLLPAQKSYAYIRATFSPLARRLTTDSRADIAPVTFMDNAPKPNDAASITGSTFTANVEANRRWTIWRKSGVAGVGSTATLYFKTQRLTLFLPTAVDPTKTVTVTATSSGNTIPGFDLDSLRGRIYFPSNANVEGQLVTVSYTDLNGNNHTGTSGATPAVTDFVQWQDEAPANTLATGSEVLPTDTASGLDTVVDTLVPIQTATNENNVMAFLDPYAGTTAANGSLNPHKVWLFWNSTRNGTADIYSETIDPRFAPSPTIP